MICRCLCSLLVASSTCCACMACMMSTASHPPSAGLSCTTTLRQHVEACALCALARIMCRRPGRQKWLFAKAACNFYDKSANKRIVDVHNNPAQATILRKDAAASSDMQGSGLEAPGSMAGTDKWRHASKRATRNAVLHDSEAMQRVRDAEEHELTMALKHVFERYNRWEGDVNGSRMYRTRFHKVFRCLSSWLGVCLETLWSHDGASTCGMCTALQQESYGIVLLYAPRS